jgi:hypothetical protein
MKPLYRQNSHYIGKSTTSQLIYRLVTKSVPCDSTRLIDLKTLISMVSLDNRIIKQQLRSSQGGTKDLIHLQVQVYLAPGSCAIEHNLGDNRL